MNPTLNRILRFANLAQIVMSVESGVLFLEGESDQVQELVVMVKQWKPELIKILNGETITDVGQCDCGSSLLGLPTKDGYINRVCPDCGQWFRCLDPYHDWSDSELIELLDERVAIIQHEGQTDQAEAEKMARQWLELIIGVKRFNRIDPNARTASGSMIDTPQNSSVPKLSSCFNGLEPIQQKWRASVEAPARLSSNF